jgi:nucleoside-diphosphate-sugar epimerase
VAHFPRPRSEAHDFIHVGDVVRANLCAAAAPAEAAGSAYTIATGTATTNAELVALAERLTGNAGSVDWRGASPSSRPTVTLDVGRAATELGFRAEISLEEGLRRLVRSLSPSEAVTA